LELQISSKMTSIVSAPQVNTFLRQMPSQHATLY
jgi:hypothetical protein